MERKWRYNFPTENKCDQLTKVNKSVIIVGERKKENGCFNPSRRRMPFSLLDIVGGVCGAEERTRHQSTQTVSVIMQQGYRLFQNLFKTIDVLLSKLINGVGNARIIELSHQFGVCGAFA